MSKDSRISFPYLIDRWHSYRASHVRESYAANLELDTSLFQDLAMIPVTQRSLQDDPMFPSACMNMGKATIPAVVSMANHTGIIMVTSPAKSRNYNMCHISEIADRMRLENYKDDYWYTKVGNTLWLSPYAKEVNAVAILDDPLQGWVLNTEKPVNGELIYKTDWQNGENYVVTGGSIIHNGVQLFVNDVFEALTPSYTGNGTIDYVTKKRKLTANDPYPMSATMAEIIFMKILTQDFKLSKMEIADVKNDMAEGATPAL